MKLKIRKRNLVTIILSVICAVLLGCSVAMLTGITSRNAFALKSSNDLDIGELTVANYDSSNGSAVFSGEKLSALYDALTGTTDNSATLNKVSASLVGTMTSTYGYPTTVNLPTYKTAADLYALNGGKNIVVSLAGQQFAVSFLTTDSRGHVIATLWMTQPLKDSSGTMVTGKFGWATANYNVNYNSTTLTSYISNAYSTSLLRMKLLNAGATSGSATNYAMGTSNANVTTLSGVVSSSERISNVLAPFTLDNTALASSAYANKSLINYIATPSQLEYTYWLSWPYASGSNASSSYLLNEALTSTMKLSTSVGTAHTNFYTANQGAHKGYWWNQGVLNYATSSVNHYNDWGSDYVWLPSLSETGYSAADGLWATGKTTTGQIKFNNENTSDSATLAGTTVSTERVWLRSGNSTYPYAAQILSSSGTDVIAYSAATLAVRPALHLDLTSAAQAAVSNGQQTDGYEIPTPTAVTENYNGAAMWFTEFAKVMSTSDPTEPKYKWIDTALHTNSSIVTIKEIKYTPKNSNGAAGTQTTISNPSTSSVVHAGVYEVTLKLATGYKWRGQALDPNDSKTSEYTFTITVSQLEMKYDLNLYDHSGNKQTTGKGEYNADSYTVKLETASGTSTISGANLPDPKFYYKGSGTGNDYGMAGNKDGFVDDSTKGYGSATGPKNAGTYVATFVDQKTESDYILKANSTTASGSLTFEITKAKVKLPTTTWTPTYTGVSQSGVLSGFDSDILEVKSVKVTTMEGGTSNTKTLTDDGNGTYKDSNGNYEFYIDDSASIVKLFAKDAGDYTIEFDLVDTDNSEWDTSVATADKTLKFTVKRASLTIEFGAPGSTGFLWSVGDTGDITLSKADGTKNGEEATVKLYWYSDDDKTTTYDMFAGKVSDNEKYDITDFEDFGAGKYYICGVLADDTAGDNVNRNYIIDDKDTNVTPEKAEVKVQIATISAGSASLDSVIWQYKTPSTNPDAVTGNHIIYTTVSGTAVSYTVQVAKLPSYCEVVSYTNATYSDAGEHTTVVKIKIADDKTGDNKMPKPADGYTYGGEGTYDYVDDANCTITFKWTIEEKEVDLSKIDFEYWNGLDVDTLGNQIWQKYDPKDPPQKSGGNFQVRIPNSNLPEGVTSATAVYGESSRKGPGTMTFDFEFTLDSNHKSSTGSNTISYSMDITGQQVPVNWTLTTLKDANGDDVLDDQNVPYYIYVLDVDPTDPVYPYIEYEYYVSDGAGGYTIISGGIEEVIRPASAGGMGASSTTPKTVYVRPVLSSSAPTTNGISDYVLKFSTSGVEYKKETVGTDKDIVDVTAGTTSMTYGGSVTVADIFKATVRNSDGTPGAALNSAFYTVELYDGNTLLTNDLSSFDFSTLDAKTYQLVFEIKSLYEESYALANSGLDFVVKPVELVVPTLKDGVTLTFNGEEQKLADSLQNFDDKYMEFASNSINEARNANPSYKAIINIKDEFVGNYIFVLPTQTAATTKSPARVVLADGEAGTTAELSNGNATATIYWAINKFVLDTTPNSAWSFTKDGAMLSYNGVPAGIKALTMGNDPSLIINVAYYDTDGNPLSDVELKGGNKFLVAAYMDPSCADANNIEFKGQAYDPLTGMTTSPQSVYTVPQSGASAILGNIKDFMTGTLLGLPVWAWFLIALALLILLIIIIVIAAKRRKTKEQREEIKAKKEEEKARKEEERQRKEEERQAQKERLEEERRLQKEKLDAERELAKAKQEAELEKIRMQAQMGAGMAGAGMATMAMQQPMQQAQQPMQQQMPQQQPMQQPMQQQPVQQAQDNTLLAEIRAQMAEMRAENRATQAQMQAMQNMQNQQPHYAPQYAPQYAPAPAPAPAAAPAADSNLMTLMEMKLQMSEMKNQQAVAEMKSAQAVAEVKAAQALAEAKAKAANHQPESHSQQSQQPIIVMAPSSPMGMMNQNAPYSPNYPNYGGYPSVNMGYGMQALPAPQQMMPPYGMMPNYGYPPYGMVPPYGYPPVAMLPQQTYAPAKAEKEEEPVVTSSSQTNPSMTVSQPPYAYPPGAVMTTTTTIDTSRADSKGVKRTAADSADDVSFDVDGFYDPFN